MKNILNNVVTMLIGVACWNLAILAAEKITHAPYKVMPRDYQMEIKGDQALIYSGDTLKGSIILFGQLDTLITKDNQ